MKAIKALLICILTLAPSAFSMAQDNVIEFGIHETINLNDIMPLTENQSRVILNQELKMDAPVMSYITINDKKYINQLKKDLAGSNAYLLPTKSFNESSSMALVSVKKEAAIDIDDISKAVPSAKGIELRFNYKGAKKFAKLTRDNTGNMIAFVINQEIWSMPMVNASIKGGVALISGITDQEIIKNTCEQINLNVK